MFLFGEPKHAIVVMCYNGGDHKLHHAAARFREGRGPHSSAMCMTSTEQRGGLLLNTVGSGIFFPEAPSDSPGGFGFQLARGGRCSLWCGQLSMISARGRWLRLSFKGVHLGMRLWMGRLG